MNKAPRPIPKPGASPTAIRTWAREQLCESLKPIEHKPKSPAQLAAYVQTGIRMRAAKQAKVSRRKQEQEAARVVMQRHRDEYNAGRALRGLPPLDFDALSKRTPPTTSP